MTPLDNVYNVIPHEHSPTSNVRETDVTSQVIAYLCDTMTTDQAMAVAKSMESSKVKKSIVENKEKLRVLMEEYIFKNDLNHLLTILKENKLYDLHDGVKDIREGIYGWGDEFKITRKQQSVDRRGSGKLMSPTSGKRL